MEAKERAKSDKEASHQKFKDEKFVFQQPSASSSSSSSNVVESNKPNGTTRASSVDSAINYYRNKTELINLSQPKLFK